MKGGARTVLDLTGEDFILDKDDLDALRGLTSNASHLVDARDDDQEEPRRGDDYEDDEDEYIMPSQQQPQAEVQPLKRRRSRMTEEEKCEALQIMCHPSLLEGTRGAALKAGAGMVPFPEANLVGYPHVRGGGVLFFNMHTQSLSQHALVCTLASDLWRVAYAEGSAVDVLNSNGLTQWADEMASHVKLVGQKITLVIEGRDASASKWVAEKNKKAYAQGTTGHPAKKEDYTVVFDEVAIFLQMSKGWNVRHCKDAQEIGKLVGQIARSIALHHQNDEDAAAAYADPGATVRAKKTDDAREVWTNMLCAIPGVSRLRAAAIVRVYPTTKSLLNAYHVPTRNDVDKAELLKDLEIPGSKPGKSRLLGPVLSKRVWTVFTSAQGTQILSAQDRDEEAE